LAKNFKELRELAKKISKKAYSPYSQAKVGSAIKTKSGKIFSGCNVENSSFSATLCAERVAIFKAVSEGEKSLSQVYVYTKDGWPPCGMCLQVMSEFADKNTEVIIGDEKGNEKVLKFSELMPNAFTPDHLKKK
jgi:cytidine deaminase